MHMGRDAMAVNDNEMEELMAALSPEELTSLVDEMGADPDDKHMPASVRNSYRCAKAPTGELNRDSLINHINQEGVNSPDAVIHIVTEFFVDFVLSMNAIEYQKYEMPLVRVGNCVS